MTDATVPLIGTSWMLARLDDPTASVGPAPTGQEVITFSARAASDNHQNAALVRITPHALQFGRWGNGLVGVYSNLPRPAGLTVDEYNFLVSVLSGDASWSVTHQELVISKHEVGSATFAATDATPP